MNILIDAGHPAHVHYYRNLAKELEQRGHKVFWTVKDIPLAKKLLDYYRFTYTVLPKKSDSLPGKIIKQFVYIFKLLRICKKEKITHIIGFSVTASHISLISKIKSIIFDDDDDEVQPIVTKFVTPYCDELLSPESLRGKRARKDTIFYPGFHELAYLHPKRFTPDPAVLQDAGLESGESFFVFRFNAFKAHHDTGVMGFSLDQKIRLIQTLEKRGKIFVSTERDIEPSLEKYRMNISPEKIHSLMSYSTLFITDSQTMTSEAAVLGVPSLRCNSRAGRRAYLDEEEFKYSLTFSFLPEEFDNLINKIDELLAYKDIKSEWQRRKAKLIEDKIDVTSFWLWFIENYPESKKMINSTKSFWQKFK